MSLYEYLWLQCDTFADCGTISMLQKWLFFFGQTEKKDAEEYGKEEYGKEEYAKNE